MQESKYIFVSTSKMFVDKTYRQIPSFKSVKRTRLFGEEDYGVAGLSNYRYFAQYFGDNIVSIDRTGTITTPFNTTLHESLVLPEGDKVKSFSDCCDERAASLLTRGKYINVMYGGGIDSVAMLTSLLKNATDKNRDLITVYLSNESITRNQKAYDELICSKLRTAPSYEFTSFMGNKNSIMVSGECGDELFGSTFIQNIMHRTTVDVMTEEPTLSTILRLLNRNVIIETDEEQKRHRQFVELLFAVADKSPVELDTVYKFFWWLNFVLNWNVSYTRLMSYATKQVVPEQTYCPFFSTSDFQLWSMNNVHTHSVEKLAAKKYINEYRENIIHADAVKSNGLSNICYNKPAVFAIDSSLMLHQQPHNIFLENNSFV